MPVSQYEEKMTVWMGEAIQQAEKSLAEGGIPIGSVLVDEHGQIVARGHGRQQDL